MRGEVQELALTPRPDGEDLRVDRESLENRQRPDQLVGTNDSEIPQAAEIVRDRIRGNGTVGARSQVVGLKAAPYPDKPEVAYGSNGETDQVN